MDMRGFVRWFLAVAVFVPLSAASAPKSKNKGKGMAAEFVRVDAKGDVTIDKGRADGVGTGCVVHVISRVRELSVEKGTAVMNLVKPLAELKSMKTLDLVCGRAKMKATIAGVAVDRENGVRVALGGLKGKKIDKGCTHSFLLGRVSRVYEKASVVFSRMGDAIANQKSFWIECP